MKKNSKISILGTGNVGSAIAYTFTLENMASEIVLVDINQNKAKGEALDIIQGTALFSPVNIYAGDYSDIKDSDIVIVTLGCARKPGQSRIDLAQGNVNIIKSVMPQAAKYAPDAVYVVVSNPVDIITYTIIKTTGLPENQVFGSGTLLDSSRLREMIAKQLNINSGNIHAYVFGEHGDTSFIPWSLNSVGGIPIEVFVKNVSNEHPHYTPFDRAKIEDDVHTSGATVISLKGATYYAIAMAARRICDSIIHNTNTIMTLSGMLHGEYGYEDICMSIPFILNSNGITNAITPPLLPEEMQKLKNSAEYLKKTISTLQI